MNGHEKIKERSGRMLTDAMGFMTRLPRSSDTVFKIGESILKYIQPAVKA